MPPFSNPKLQSPLLIQILQANPILNIDVSILQLRDLLTGSIDFRKIRTLRRYYSGIVGKHVHRKPIQLLQILLISLILHFPLIIDIRQEIATFQIHTQILGIPEILRRYQSALHELRPLVPLQDTLPALTQPIVTLAILKFADAIVLGSKGDEGGNARLVAALNIGAQELTALREADCVDGGGCGEDRVGG